MAEREYEVWSTFGEPHSETKMRARLATPPAQRTPEAHRLTARTDGGGDRG